MPESNYTASQKSCGQKLTRNLYSFYYRALKDQFYQYQDTVLGNTNQIIMKMIYTGPAIEYDHVTVQFINNLLIESIHEHDKVCYTN